MANGSAANQLTPLVVDARTSYQDASAGYTHICGISVAGDLKCRGRDDLGQLGDGTTVNRVMPFIIDGGVKYKAIASAYHTCEIITAGRVRCWGYNVRSQAGDGTTPDCTLPFSVDPGSVYSESALSSISNGA